MNGIKRSLSAIVGGLIGLAGFGYLVAVNNYMSLESSWILGWRYLLWPGFLLGRFGLKYTGVAVLLAIVTVIFMIVRSLRGKRRNVFFLVVPCFSVLVYGCLGLIYVSWCPIPRPAFSMTGEYQFPPGAGWETYLGAYDEAYRWGIIDSWHNLDGYFEKEVLDGWVDGYQMGVSEWESIAPGHLESGFRKLARQIETDEHKAQEPKMVDERDLEDRITFTVVEPKKREPVPGVEIFFVSEDSAQRIDITSQNGEWSISRAWLEGGEKLLFCWPEGPFGCSVVDLAGVQTMPPAVEVVLPEPAFSHRWVFIPTETKDPSNNGG